MTRAIQSKPKTVVRTIDGVTHIIQKRSRRQRFERWLKRSKAPGIIGVTLAVLVIILAAYLYQIKHAEPRTLSQVTAALSRHMILPKEEPILATVTDKSSLRTAFLQEADNGDKILFYEKAKRVIIYRPSIDRIVDIGPLELSNIPKTNN